MKTLPRIVVNALKSEQSARSMSSTTIERLKKRVLWRTSAFGDGKCGRKVEKAGRRWLVMEWL
jgi:hypothetical protein